jgi:4a-hydroxytetrahydrobiopterin dehydratase
MSRLVIDRLACGGTTDMSDAKEKTYTDTEIAAKIQEHGLTDWYLEDGWLRRKYTTDGWPTTLMLTNAIGYLCEAAWHHADLAITWGKLWVKLKTHSAGGITDKDFALAKKIEEVVLWRPQPGGPLQGTPNKFVQAKK